MKRLDFLKTALAIVATPAIAKLVPKQKPKVLRTITIEFAEPLPSEEAKAMWKEALAKNPPRKTSLNYLQNFREHYEINETAIYRRFKMSEELGLLINPKT